MISKDKTSKLSNSLKEILSNNDTSNRDLELLDNVKNRESSEKNFPERKLTPQLYYTPEEFKRTHPLFPDYPKFFYPIDYDELHPLNIKDIDIK